tara:strand:- start:12 stop:1196 length:1185 start_codon:yes stop_codon:yes gene_type:complete
MKAKIVNLDGNYSEPLETDDGSTKNVSEYFEYHREFQPASLEIGSIVDVITMMGNGGYPAECILISNDEPNPYGLTDWYLGLLPSNLQMISEPSVSKRNRGEVRLYKDDKEDGFENSGLPDEMQDAYDEGWEQGISQEDQLANMTEQDYERKLGELTRIVNFNGQMTLFENQNYNGKITEYVISQIQYGYAPPSLGIGYEVNLIDWVQNPNPEEYVVVSSKELVPEFMAAPSIAAAQYHWTLFLRKENLEMFQPDPAMAEAQLELAKDFEMMGEIAELDLGIIDPETLRQYLGREILIKGRGELYVRPDTGELMKMESPKRGWKKVERMKVMGQKLPATLHNLVLLANESSKLNLVSESATQVVLESNDTKKLSKALSKVFSVEVSGDTMIIEY